MLCGSIWLLCAFFWTGCERESSIPGQYEAFNSNGEPANLILRLDANGQGSWSLGGDYVEIRWKTRGSRIVMHTKTGGVFQGTVIPDKGPQITVTLANLGTFEFKKSTL